MTVKELKRILKKLPDDMDVMMPLDDDTLVTVCKLKSEVVDIDIPINPDDENSEMETHSILLLLPCGCEEEMEPGEINSQPELN